MPPAHQVWGAHPGRTQTAVGVTGWASSQVPVMGRDVPCEPLCDGGDCQGSGWAALHWHSFATTQWCGCKDATANVLPQTILALFFWAANAGASITPSACAVPGLAAEPQRALPWCHPAPGCGAGPCTAAVHTLKLQGWSNGFH